MIIQLLRLTGRYDNMSSASAEVAAAQGQADSSAGSALLYPDDNNGPVLMKVVWTLLAFTTIIFALRIYTKANKTYRLYWDDCLMFVALVCEPALLYFVPC
jgi:tryptophan-rich sensory protein